MAGWQNRIVGHEDVPPSQLLANPKNWRLHPQFQQTGVQAVLDDVGWVRDILVNKRTGFVIDGHLRVTLALREDEPTVPVSYVDLSEEEEAKVLAALDPLAALAEPDPELLKALAEEVDVTLFWRPGELQEILQRAEYEGTGSGDISGMGNEEDPQEPEEDDSINIYAYRPDAIFPSSSNNWDIPDLRDDMLSDQIPHVIWAGQEIGDAQDTLFLWGTNTFPKEAQGGVLGFYVDDKRFVTVWTEAVQILEKLAKFGWGAVLSPDFSLWRNWPLAIQLFNLYRARWCARYWQEAGVRIIPSLNWSDERTYDWAFKGIPKGAPVVAAQCRTLKNKEDQAFFLQGIAEAIRQVEPQKLMLYGGEDHREWLEPVLGSKVEVEWLESWTTMRRRIRFQN